MAEKEFKTFSNRQDSLFLNAYKEKNTISYNKLLNEFLTKYYNLTPTERKSFSWNVVKYYGLETHRLNSGLKVHLVA